MNSGCGRNILNADSEHIKHFEEPCLRSARCCCLKGALTESSKDHSAILSSQLLQGGGEHGKTSEFHELGPFITFFCCAVSSLIIRSSVWDTMMVDKVFSKSLDSCFGRSIASKTDKSVSRISVYSSENKMLSLP